MEARTKVGSRVPRQTCEALPRKNTQRIGRRVVEEVVRHEKRAHCGKRVLANEPEEDGVDAMSLRVKPKP